MFTVILMPPKKKMKKAEEVEDDDEDEAKAKAKAKAKTTTKAMAKKPASMPSVMDILTSASGTTEVCTAAPLDTSKLKRLRSKITYGLKHADPEKQEEARQANAAYYSATHEDKVSILEQIENHKNLKWIPSFVRTKSESRAVKSTEVNDWMDMYAINGYLKYPLEVLQLYCNKLPSRDHRDPVSKDCGLKEYHFVWSSAKAAEFEEIDKRELTCAAQKLTTKMIDDLASGSSASKDDGNKAVQIVATDEYIRLQKDAKQTTIDQKKTGCSITRGFRHAGTASHL